MLKRLTLILACGLGVAACGSSSNNDPKNSSQGYSDALAFSACMRAHGVSNFPDPISSGGAIRLSIGSSSGVNPQSPAFQSAQRSCRHLLPGGGTGPGSPSPQAMARMLHVSQCMRAHGISGFPDPTTTAPSNPSDYSVVTGRDGVWLTIPKSIDPRSPAFRAAAAACNLGPMGQGF
jgi:hypothetical protein